MDANNALAIVELLNLRSCVTSNIDVVIKMLQENVVTPEFLDAEVNIIKSEVDLRLNKAKEILMAKGVN